MIKLVPIASELEHASASPIHLSSTIAVEQMRSGPDAIIRHVTLLDLPFSSWAVLVEYLTSLLADYV
jgi:hypothetical protein